MHRTALLSCIFAASTASAALASDLNPAGFYVGAAAVQSSDVYTQLGTADQTHTGWKVMAGLRPLHFLGAELEYADLGNAGFLSRSGPLGGDYSGTRSANTTGLFAVAYLPLPTPFLDIFAKVGGQRTHTTADGVVYCGIGPVICDLIAQEHVNETETDFAYGAGVQAKLRSLALRVEYERTETSVGQPRLLSFGVTWTF